MTADPSWWMPTFVLTLLLVLVPAFCILRAPVSYRDFRLPDFLGQLRSLSHRKVPLLMGFAQVTEAFAAVYAAAWINRRLKHWSWDAFIAQPVLELDFFTIIALLSPVAIMAAFRARPGQVIFFIKGFAFYSISCVGLQAWIDLSLAGTGLFQTLEVVFVVFASLSQIAQYTVVLATIGSRWRFIVYVCVVGVLSLAAQACALLLVGLHPSIGWLLAVTVVGGLSRLAAAAFFSTEATGILRTKRERTLMVKADAVASQAQTWQQDSV